MQFTDEQLAEMRLASAMAEERARDDVRRDGLVRLARRAVLNAVTRRIAAEESARPVRTERYYGHAYDASEPNRVAHKVNGISKRRARSKAARKSRKRNR